MRPEPIDQQRSQREPQPLLEILCLREGREIEVGGKLFRCRSHAILRLTNSGGERWRQARKAVQIQFQKRAGITDAISASPCFPYCSGKRDRKDRSRNREAHIWEKNRPV